MEAHNPQVDKKVEQNRNNNLEKGTVNNAPSDETLNGHGTIAQPPKDEAISAKRPGLLSRARLFGAVDGEHADLILLAHSLTTGMVDGASFSNWGVFVGMQTGNTVILGLSTATIDSNPHAWLTTLVSVLSYLIGAFCTFRLASLLLHTKPLTTNRFALSTALATQALLILLAAGLASPSHLIPHTLAPSPTDGPTPDIIDNINIVALIPPLAFQSGIQIAVSRLLGFNELPVNVLTSTYCDLMGDMKLLAVRNVKRNRRVASVVLLLAGAVSAAWLLRSRAGLMGVLWIAGGVKLLAAVGAFVFLPAKKIEVKV